MRASALDPSLFSATGYGEICVRRRLHSSNAHFAPSSSTRLSIKRKVYNLHNRMMYSIYSYGTVPCLSDCRDKTAINKYSRINAPILAPLAIVLVQMFAFLLYRSTGEVRNEH